MKATELRLGNYVWNDVQNIPVKADVRILQEQINANKGFGYTWQPVPLTEDILVKCGFERSEYNDYRHPVLIGTLTLYEGVAELHISDLYSVWVNNLHQLQNLFYVLAGEELEINL